VTAVGTGTSRQTSHHPAHDPSSAWQEQIVAEVTRRVGAVPVLLAGSRAVGTARADSDYDVAVVMPLLRIPRAISRLAVAADRLTAELGATVSVNPVPGFRMRRPGGSLFVGKLRAEGDVLAAPRGWSLRPRPLTRVTVFAASSVLLSAVQNLLEAFDTSAMRRETVSPRARDALRKAALHVAQVRLLRSGRYASDLETALARLRSTPPSRTGDASGAELARALMSGLGASDPIDGFLHLRQCILGQLAEVTDAPLRMRSGRSLVRNSQYAVLARLRGRNRWRVALRLTAVEAALAAAQVGLLRALDPGAVDGFDATRLRLAVAMLPPPLGAAGICIWEDARDLALAEWPDAHPLVGVLA
jgi:hypothetical protein